MKLHLAVHRVKYAREAGQVRRCHTVPVIGEYDVAQHSYNMLTILRILYPDCNKCLIWAIVVHDIPERTTGDIPATSKWAGIVDVRRLEDFEEKILIEVGLTHTVLSTEESRIFKGLDMLELFLWTKDQENLGNRNAKKMENRIMRWVAENNEKVPDLILGIFRSASQSWEFLEELGDL